MPTDQLAYFPVHTLRGYPERPDGRHRYDSFTWHGQPPPGNDDPKSLSNSQNDPRRFI